ncbi:MAG: nitroreductase family protein [Planctomycetes bacterium]|nr:nitroreductase family protein [Planctomycetota bacterium]
MDFLELVKKRQSVRRYSDKPVDREKIDYCLEAARMSPSACNSQPWKFIVIDDPQLRPKIAKETFGKILSFNRFSMTAPVLVAIVREKQTAFAKFGAVVRKKDFTSIDIGIAAEHFCLAAAEQGLGTCMLGWFDEKAVKKMLKVPSSKRVTLIITLGYADDETVRDKKRKQTDEMSGFNNYNKTDR